MMITFWMRDCVNFLRFLRDSDVRSKPRLLDYKSKDENPAVFTPWIITFGAGYRETKEKVREVNETISNTRTWSNTSPTKIPTLQVVTRKAPNLKDILFKQRRLALGSSSNTIVPCITPGKKKKGRPCMTCTLVSGTSSVTSNDRTTNTQGGNCKSKSIVYAATFQLCQKNNVYVSKSVCTLSQRVNGHRSKF